MPSLTHTQRLLWQLITAPEGAAAGLAQLVPAERAAAEAFVRGDGRLSATERIDVYADMYFYRIRDSLKEDFISLHAVIGEARFHNLITDYLLAHPPSHFSLRYAGQRLPEFLQSHSLSARWPYVTDLAAMEWAILEAFDAPDAEPIEGADLAAVPAEHWGNIQFTLTPSLQLLDLRWPVQMIWERVQRGEPACELQPNSTVLRVWRQDWRVFHRVIDVAEHAALRAIQAGGTFASACECIAAHAADGAETAAKLIAGWIAEGLVSGLRLAE